MKTQSNTTRLLASVLGAASALVSGAALASNVGSSQRIPLSLRMTSDGDVVLTVQLSELQRQILWQESCNLGACIDMEFLNVAVAEPPMLMDRLYCEPW